MNLFSVRNLWSYLISISIAMKTNKNKNILLIYKNKINPKILNILKIYSKKYYCKIYLLDQFIDLDFSLNYIRYHKKFYDQITSYKNNQKIKKLNFLNQNYVKNFFLCGDVTDTVLIKKFNLKCNFYFVEHGIGNYISFIRLNFLKNKLNNYLYNLLLFFKIFKLEKIIYLGYYGFFSGLNKIHINDKEIPQIKINYFENQFKKFSKFVFKIKKIKKIKINYKLLNKKKLVFLSIPNYIKKNSLKKFVNTALSLVEKDEFLILKTHPSSNNNIKGNLIYLKKILKNNKIKYFEINNSFLKELSIELISCKLNINKYITGISSGPLALSMLKKKLDINMILGTDTHRKKWNIFTEFKKSSIKFYKRKFKNINFIEIK